MARPFLFLPRFHHSLTKEWPDSPSLRASNEHSYIVRVLRSKKDGLAAPFSSFLLCQMLKHSLTLHLVFKQ